MKNKVITLNGNLQYYVLEEIKYKNRNYIMAFQVDNENEVATNNFVFCEVVSELNQTKVINIEPHLLNEISNELIKLINKENVDIPDTN